MDSCALSEEEENQLKEHVESRGAIFISTPFSRAAANRLNRFNVPAFKIGSGECNNYPLIKHIAKEGKPIILSTGMNSIESVKPSVDIMRKYNIPYILEAHGMTPGFGNLPTRFFKKIWDIFFGYNIFGGNRCPKARPSGSGYKFLFGAKQWFSGNDIYVNPLLFIIPVGIIEWRLCAVFLCHFILQ